MKYDLNTKRLFDLGAKDIVRSVLSSLVGEQDALEEVGQETPALKRADCVLRVSPPQGEPWILLLEFLTQWRAAKMEDLLLYTVLHRQKERERRKREGASSQPIPVVHPVMLLFQPNDQATDVYRDEHITFRFKLVKMWELDAREHIERGAPEVCPLAALMDGGVELASRIDEAICSSDRPPEIKADLMNIFAIFLGLRDPERARQIIKQRIALMMESPIYQDILQEGREEGLEEGMEKGLAKGREEGLEKGLQKGLQKGMEKGYGELRENVKLVLEMKFGAPAFALFSKIDDVRDLEAFGRIREGLRAGESLDTIERLIAEMN